MNNKKTEYEDDIAVSDDISFEKPRPYNVLLHNDNYTTMEFVVLVLMTIFHHTPENAERLMSQVHHKGQAIVGTYPLEIAQTKVTETTKLARENEFPLKCTLESR